jgi:hypothetical protein
MACKLALHRIIAQQGENLWDDQNRLIELNVPDPDAVSLSLSSRGINKGKNPVKLDRTYSS